MTDLAPVAYNVTTGALIYDNGAGGVAIPYTGPAGPTGATGPAGPAGSGAAPVCLGRLTLTASTPVMMADAVNQSTIYYAPHLGNTVPVWNGTDFVARTFTSSDTDTVGLTLSLDSNAAHTGYHQNDKVFDLFIYWDSTLCRLSTGPAWSTLTTRGTGAGTTELQRIRGLKTNKNSITLRYGVNSGDTATVAANQAIYVGSVYMTANGQTGMAIRPARAAGGTNNKIALYNEYNKVPITVLCADSTSTWNYASGSVRSFNNSNNNRIWWLDGSGEMQVRGLLQATISPASASANAYTCGVAYNSTVQLGIGTINQGAFVGATNVGQTMLGFDTVTLMGWNYCQALEQSTTIPVTVYANGFSALELTMAM